jgi:hypothetical protein
VATCTLIAGSNPSIASKLLLLLLLFVLLLGWVRLKVSPLLLLLLLGLERGADVSLSVLRL